jgi:hypothetical protein
VEEEAARDRFAEHVYGAAHEALFDIGAGHVALSHSHEWARGCVMLVHVEDCLRGKQALLERANLELQHCVFVPQEIALLLCAFEQKHRLVLVLAVKQTRLSCGAQQRARAACRA